MGRTGYVIVGVIAALLAFILLPGWVKLLGFVLLVGVPAVGYMMLDPSQRRRLRGQARKRLG
ncbi:hypothetical protein [Actinomadura sp. DC4]|uniref:hypothetical protein n=1 Tax=Actinomadura sp. DC4 TaxID=3055069 RepID=UPI0025AFFF58|nr:hypothetical protein [Actinomadura sp. DC4]MDN3357042.1 hypothetical protein [Actinomadura sp. DC4]